MATAIIKTRWVWLAAFMAALTGLAVAGWRGHGTRRGAPLVLPAEDQTIAQLAARLESRGLALRFVPAAHRGSSPDAFLTEGCKSWEELNGLPKLREHIDRWTGTVYCERLNNPRSRALQISLWGDYCLEAGPFLFFGDPALLARIRQALEEPEHRQE
jgi:hypothetical protein